MDEQLIRRINELAKKAKTEGLTAEEKDEQTKLRAEYILQFRRNLRAQIENIELEYPDGTVVSLKERHDERFSKTEYEP
ncbi:MAG: DUF896 domain-containing protein [Lachnospiraceae bacterium]|nr:DUF896 domain-containing protein [Lachnospiraceae bacterium]